MGLFSRKQKEVRKVEEKSGGLDALIFDGGGRSNTIPNSYSGRVAEGYEVNPYVYKCVNTRAKAIANVVPQVFDMKGEEIEDRNHPLLKLLRKPNPLQSLYDMMYTVECHLSIDGNAFLLPIKTIKGIVQLWPVRPDLVTYMEGTDMFTPVRQWMITAGGMSVTLEPDALIHIKAFPGNDPVLGASPLAAAGLAVAQQNAARDWNRNLLDNYAKPSIAITSATEMAPKQFQAFVASLRMQYSGSGNAGKPIVMDAGKQIQSIGLSPTEMDWTSGMTVSAKEIAIAFEVPPEKIGDSANKTYSNAAEANREFAMSMVQPECRLIWSSLDRYLSPYYDDVDEISFDSAGIPGIMGDQTAIMSALNSTSFLTINEKRDALGYDAIPIGGDEIMMPFGFISLSEYQEPPADINPPE